MKLNKKYFLHILIIFLIISCGSSYQKSLSRTESFFYTYNYEKALDAVREETINSNKRDKLLFLMEAGIVLHTKKDYVNSNKALMEADYIAETINTSITKQAASFLINDTKENFKGENFERVQIKFYIALNFLMLGDLMAAKQYLRKLDYELKAMKYIDDKYKQNAAARLIDAIISEKLERYNDSRVQYNNLIKLYPDDKKIAAGRYVLAVKEEDKETQEKFSAYKNNIECFNLQGNAITYNTNLAELVIINQAGKAAVKASRGKISGDAALYYILRIGLEYAILTEGKGLSLTAILAMVSRAENPFPIYKMRDSLGSKPVAFILNNKNIGTTDIYNSFSETAIHNFNDNYDNIIIKNTTSIAFKIVAAALIAKAASDKIQEQTGGNEGVGVLVNVVMGAGMGAAIAATIKPDLRCWRLLADNTQVKRIFLEPGIYNLDMIRPKGLNSTMTNQTIELKAGELKIITMRTMTEDTVLLEAIQKEIDKDELRKAYKEQEKEDRENRKNKRKKD